MQIFTRKLFQITNTVLLLLLVVVIVSTPARVKGQNGSGSVVSVRVDSTKNLSLTSLEQLVQGNVSGVRVTASDGAPETAYDVLIRGINFIKGSNQPLYILDGVILNSARHDVRKAYWNDDTDYQMLQNSLSAINPADILRIEVLKDATTTAIYGSMGANGVIVITTRQGLPGSTKVNWISNISFASTAKTLTMLDKLQYLDYMGDKGLPVNGQGNGIDWQKDICRTAISHNHFISLSGQDKDKTAYYISASLRRQTGIVEKSGSTYANFRINVERPLGKYSKIGTRTMFAYGETEMISGVNTFGYSTIIGQSILAAPMNFNHDPYSDEYFMDSPLAMIADSDDKSFEYRVIPSLFVESNIRPWLSIKSLFGVDFRDKKRQRWTGNGVYKGFLKSGMIGRADAAGLRYNFDNTLNADVQKALSRFTATAGFSLNGNYFYDKISDGYDIPEVAHLLRTKGMSAARQFFTGNYKTYTFTMYSAYAQAAYSYSQKYFLTATCRGDNYNTFTNDWDVYPSLSIAWDMGKEKFMGGVEFISNLKLRASWGKSGIKSSEPYRYFPFANSFEYKLNEDPITHPIVAYDTYWHADMSEFNIGMDAALFKDRVRITVDYFSRKTDEKLDIIYTTAKTKIPSTEVSLPSKMTIEGFEAAIGINIINKAELSWKAAGNIFFNTSKIKTAGSGSDQSFWYGNSVGLINGLPTPATIFAEGQAPGLFYGFRTKGLLNDQTAITSASFRGNELAAGNIRFLDKDRNGDINDLDKTVIGDPNPIFSFGFNTSLNYRNFSFSADFYGNYGGDICNLNLLNELNTGDNSTYNVRKDAYLNAWSASNKKTSYPALGSYGMTEVSRRIIEDGSFLRCSDITFGYSIPLSSSVKKWVKALNASFSVKNAFVITNYSGYDPEVNSFSSDISRYGFDIGSYPRARTFVVGINATF